LRERKLEHLAVLRTPDKRVFVRTSTIVKQGDLTLSRRDERVTHLVVFKNLHQSWGLTQLDGRIRQLAFDVGVKACMHSGAVGSETNVTDRQHQARLIAEFREHLVELFAKRGKGGFVESGVGRHV